MIQSSRPDITFWPITPNGYDDGYWGSRLRDFTVGITFTTRNVSKENKTTIKAILMRIKLSCKEKTYAPMAILFNNDDTKDTGYEQCIWFASKDDYLTTLDDILGDFDLHPLT